MVDVERRPSSSLSPAHSAALRRLSARAFAPSHAPSLPALHSFSAAASAAVRRLQSLSIPVLSGLSQLTLQSLLPFPLPPDLAALLAAGVPSPAAGFPDYRSAAALRSSLLLPLAAVDLQLAAGKLWPRSAGPRRPPDPATALRRARAALRRAPPLVPILGRYYLPAVPCLAGNPVFYVDECLVICVAADLAEFFDRLHSFRSPEISPAVGRTPRWVEFWSDAACERRRRPASESSSSSSAASSPRASEVRQAAPEWVEGFLESVGEALRGGGWGEAEVREMVGGSPAARLPGDAGDMVDGQVVADWLVVGAERLRRAGWSHDEVGEALGIDSEFRWERRRAPVVVPPEIAIKVQELLKSVG